MWMDETLKTLVDVVKRGICSLRKPVGHGTFL
jgi:hypothetical protein